nr:helix-turn-helix domain-containing protein [Lactobacillus xylocopicola]
MNSLNSTISSHHQGQHLALQDRVIIQVLRQQGQSLHQLPLVSTVHPQP